MFHAICINMFHCFNMFQYVSTPVHSNSFQPLHFSSFELQGPPQTPMAPAPAQRDEVPSVVNVTFVRSAVYGTMLHEFKRDIS